MSATRKPTRAVKLGVTDDDYTHRLALQGGGCAICGSTPKTRRLHVDHDHATGEVRGLLCHRCNRTLASWVSPVWLWLAAIYLKGDTVSHLEGYLCSAATDSAVNAVNSAAAELGLEPRNVLALLVRRYAPDVLATATGRRVGQ